jgi:hypothetical protein
MNGNTGAVWVDMQVVLLFLPHHYQVKVSTILSSYMLFYSVACTMWESTSTNACDCYEQLASQESGPHLDFQIECYCIFHM